MLKARAYCRINAGITLGAEYSKWARMNSLARRRWPKRCFRGFWTFFSPSSPQPAQPRVQRPRFVDAFRARHLQRPANRFLPERKTSLRQRDIPATRTPKCVGGYCASTVDIPTQSALIALSSAFCTCLVLQAHEGRRRFLSATVLTHPLAHLTVPTCS